MSTLTWIILAVVVIVVVAAVVAAVVMHKRKQESRRLRAEELRRDAQAHDAGTLSETQREAERRAAEAEQARIEAQRAEERAEAARRQAQVDEARVEDQVREADRLDPDVDHRSSDYTPSTPGASSTEVTTGSQETSRAADTTPPGSHRG